MSVSFCPFTGKVDYPTSRLAHQAAKKTGRKAYVCIECGGWHLATTAGNRGNKRRYLERHAKVQKRHDEDVRRRYETR